MSQIKLSMCSFQNGSFDLFITDAQTGEEVCITGDRTFTDEEHEFFCRLMPSCVFTTYNQVSP